MGKGIVPKVTVTIAGATHITVQMKPVSGQRGTVPGAGNSIVGTANTVTVAPA